MNDYQPLRILILEDSPERQEILKQLFRDHAWVLVHTAARAIRLLEAYEFDLVTLDFDLAGEETGDVVADQLRRGPDGQTRVVVHSMNPQGRERIAALLPTATLLPISAMTKTNQRFKALREALKNGPDFDWSFAVKGGQK
ncbi:MAG: cyclic-phosphate processing receiver domain-containing protein [bacterium]